MPSPSRKISLIMLLIGIILSFSFTDDISTILKFEYPQSWPTPTYDFNRHPITEEGFQLGRQLFYDPILSKDSTISCSSCHLQSTGFTHVDHDLSHGIDGKIGTRNSLALMNLAWNKTFMWDGGVNHIEVQALAPITNPLEMNETMQEVVHKLQHSSKYKLKFKDVFKDSIITGQHVLLAISQFLLSLNSFNSKYDKYMRKEKNIELTQQELNGLKLFRSNCATCHPEPLFTTGNFENNGLTSDPELHDIGRMRITSNGIDSLKFKVPTLRNIQFSKPYMHDGRFRKLSEVLQHYSNGITKVNTLSKQLKHGVRLSANEQIDIIAFLYTLTDNEFLFNPRFSDPIKP